MVKTLPLPTIIAVESLKLFEGLNFRPLRPYHHVLDLQSSLSWQSLPIWYRVFYIICFLLIASLMSPLIYYWWILEFYSRISQPEYLIKPPDLGKWISRDAALIKYNQLSSHRFAELIHRDHQGPYFTIKEGFLGVRSWVLYSVYAKEEKRFLEVLYTVIPHRTEQQS